MCTPAVFSWRQPCQSLLFVFLIFPSLPAFRSANALGGDRCLAGKAARVCRITPLGFSQGKPAYDPYEALGVPPNAPLESIQQAYRVKARVCHPDKLRLSCPTKRGRAAEEESVQALEEEPFVIINAAYEMLKKPEDRRLFDRSGSGDGGRFVRRNVFESAGKPQITTTIKDLFDIVVEGLGFDSDAAEEDDEDDDFSYFDVAEEEGDGEELREEEDSWEWSAFDSDFDFSGITDFFE